jgi:hypothetical protein
MQEINWPYSFNEVSQDKSTWRSSCKSPIWELAGIDGTVTGALNPHPGMKEAWVFRYDLISAGEFGGTNPFSADPARATIVDFWPFTCKVGTNSMTYGVVYLACPFGSVGQMHLLIEGYNTATSSYYQSVIQKNINAPGDPAYVTCCPQANTNYILTPNENRLLSVVSTPRVVYVFASGGDPYAITFPSSGSPALSITTAGPGIKPKGNWSSTATTNFVPTGPGATTQLPDPVVSGNPPGSFCVYSSSASGSAPAAGWFDTVVRWNTATSQKAGDYAFAVQFEDSRTGRRSQLSDSVAVTFSGNDRKFTTVGVVDSNKYDTVKIWRSVRTTNAAGVFAAGILQLESVFKASDYSISPASPTYSAGVVSWAYAVQKDDRQLVMQDTFQDKPAFLSVMPRGGVAASYQNQMFVSGIQGTAPDTSDQMNSVGEIRWSSATDGSYELFNPRGRWTPEIHGNDPIVFKQAGQVLLGLSRSRVFFIMRDGAFVRVSTAHNGYGVVNPYAAEEIGPMVYYITKQGMRVVYPDGRLDEVGAIDWLITNDWKDDLECLSMAYDSGTSALYLLNPVKDKAVVFWFSSGMCSEMHYFPFKKCARGNFPSSSANPAGRTSDCALFLLSPDVSMVPAYNPLQPEDPFNVYALEIDSHRPRLMRIADSGTDRCHVPPLPTEEGVHYGLIDGDAPRNFDARTFSQLNSQLYEVTLVDFPDIWLTDTSIVGSYFFVNSDGTIGGGADDLCSFKIVSWGKPTGSTTSFLLIPAEPDDVFRTVKGAPTNIAYATINPVVLKIGTSSMPGIKPEVGFLTNKEVSSMGMLFQGVSLSQLASGNGAVGFRFARWYGGLFQADEPNPYSVSCATNTDKTTIIQTVTNGGSPIHANFNKKLDLFQSVTMFMLVAGFDCRVLAMNVRGRILETERSKNSYV